MTNFHFRKLVFAYCQLYQKSYWFDQLENAFTYLELAGEFVSPLEWDYIEPFDEEGFAVVHMQTNNGKTKRYGVINESGQWQVEPIWLNITQRRQVHPAAVKWPDVQSTVFDSSGWCLVQAESGFGWIDKNGRVVSPLMWMSVSDSD